MNFLCEPAHAIHPNSTRDDDQLSMAARFVDELLDIGALGTTLSLESVLTTTPLFCVSKPHQPGMWRVIADMKAGGQNAAVGSDLVYLPHIGHILDELYTGGYMAVVDASKFFHQFSTHLADRPYLGVVHPISSTLLQWFGLPMGAANSPSLGGRYGLTFLCLLCSEAPHLFGTSGHANCWWTGFTSSGSYDPDLGYGFVLTHPDGLPAVKVWVLMTLPCMALIMKQQPVLYTSFLTSLSVWVFSVTQSNVLHLCRLHFTVASCLTATLDQKSACLFPREKGPPP
jgi:hypothetical protein